ncbi:MAG: hypothetical protein ACK4LQ_09695 [Pararhodobacter sp.]
MHQRTPRRRRHALKGLALALLVSASPPGAAWAQSDTAEAAQSPLSAIDWLRETMVLPEPGAYPVSSLRDDVWFDSGDITTRTIDATMPDSVGLFAAARVGLPRHFWAGNSASELADLVVALPTDTLPALRDLSYRILLAEFDPPGITLAGSGGDVPPGAASPLLLARLDKLMEFGAIDQAAALLDTLGPIDPGLQQRRFEIALLLGEEQAACRDLLRRDPEQSVEPVLIFCQARHGDWHGAERRLERAREAGTLGPLYEPLLTRFLDADDHLHSDDVADSIVLRAQAQLSPLSWRLLEAIGEPVATFGLPVAFAHADLRGTIGWRAQLEAAERLVRTGALPPNRLLGLYTERSAAASGGIWERVRAVQALDAALERNDPGAIGAALLRAWPQIVAGELELAFTQIYSDILQGAGLEGPAAALAFEIGLLSERYENVALTRQEGAGTIPLSPREAFLIAVARGLAPDPAAAEGNSAKMAVAEAFAEDPALPESTLARLQQGRVGEQVLITLNRMGGAADPRVQAEELATLRYLGLEDIARRAALQSLLLERRG